MRRFAQKQSQAQQPASLDLTRPHRRTAPEASRETHPAPHSHGFAHDFSRIPAHSQAPLIIQKKPLGVSSPTDADEKEADEVARKVVDGQSASISVNSSNIINRKETGHDEPTAELESEQQNIAGGGVDPYKERRLQGAVYKLSEKFGFDFNVLFVAGHLSGFVNTISADAKGQMDLTNKISEFDFKSLRNSSDDPYPSTLDLQSVMSWQINSKGKYVKNSWKKRDFATEPSKITMVDNPGFRGGGVYSVDLVMDLAATAATSIRFIVRLMIVEKKPVA